MPISRNRIVDFFPAKTFNGAYTPGEPLTAIVVHVWSPSCVNLTVFDKSGVCHGLTSVVFSEELLEAEGYATWPEYFHKQRAQVTQSAQQESAAPVQSANQESVCHPIPAEAATDAPTEPQAEPPTEAPAAEPSSSIAQPVAG
jgi:hypothetical protein